MGYDPEMDVSQEVRPNTVRYIQSIMDIPRWMVELGRINTIIWLSLLSSHLTLPREGHQEAALHIIAYMGQKYNSRLVYNTTYP